MELTAEEKLQLATKQLYTEMNVNRMLIANLYKNGGVGPEKFVEMVDKARDTVNAIKEVAPKETA